jgi:hypothetical protein
MCFVTKVFYGEELLAPHPTPKLEDHIVSAVRDCLFNIFAATLLIGGRSSIRNPSTLHAVVTGTQLSHGALITLLVLNCSVPWAKCMNWTCKSNLFFSFVAFVRSRNLGKECLCSLFFVLYAAAVQFHLSCMSKHCNTYITRNLELFIHFSQIR